MPQLSVQIAGEPDRRIRVDQPCTIRGGHPDEEAGFPGLPDAVLSVTPLASGLLLESSIPLAIGVRSVPAGTPRLLRNDERAALGPAVLTAIGDPPPEGTRELARAMLAGLDPTPLSGPGVCILEGAGAGRRFAVQHGMVIGRGTGADVALEDGLVSRRHVRLDLCGDALLARDLGSKNGIRVNARRPRGKRATLRAGDEIQIGRTLLVVEHPSPSSNPQVDGAAPSDGERVSSGKNVSRTETIAIAFASAALIAAAMLLARAAG